MFAKKMVLANSIIALSIWVAASASVSALIVNDTDPSVHEICSLLPPNKYILRPQTCTNWVKCASSANATDFEEGACVLGLYFNKDDSRCSYEDNVQCPYTATGKNTCALKGDDVFISDIESDNCRGYIYCKNGKELHATCPSDLVFDPKKGACVYEQDYQCPMAIQSRIFSPICRSIGSHQLLAHETDCTKYHECDNEILLTHECDDGMAFDHPKARCVPKDDVTCYPSAKKPLPDSKVCLVDGVARTGYIPDRQSCSSYYICAKQADDKPDLHPIHMQCDEGYFFDQAKWSCRDRLNVPCALDRCERTTNKYVNIAGDCTAYARCSNGSTVATGHCPTNYFFDERSQGCTPQKINYIACSETETTAV